MLFQLVGLVVEPQSPTLKVPTPGVKSAESVYGEHETALGDALIVGLAYALAALIPLWPYFAWDVRTALPISLAATAVALFALGLAKGKVARLALVRSGFQVLVIGGASAGVGYLIGTTVAG